MRISTALLPKLFTSLFVWTISLSIFLASIGFLLAGPEPRSIYLVLTFPAYLLAFPIILIPLVIFDWGLPPGFELSLHARLHALFILLVASIFLLWIGLKIEKGRASWAKLAKWLLFVLFWFFLGVVITLRMQVIYLDARRNSVEGNPPSAVVRQDGEN